MKSIQGSKNLTDLSDWIVNKKDKIVEKIFPRNFKYEIEETKSALKGFTKQYTINGKDGVDAVSFLNSIQPQVLGVLNKNHQTKVNLILTCIMERVDLKTGEITSIDAPFLSKNEIILPATDTVQVFRTAKSKMLESMAAFQNRGSNWRFRRVMKLDIHTVVYKPLRGSSYMELPEELAGKKGIVNMKNKDNQCFKWCVTRAFNPLDNQIQSVFPKY